MKRREGPTEVISLLLLSCPNLGTLDPKLHMIHSTQLNDWSESKSIYGVHGVDTLPLTVIYRKEFHKPCITREVITVDNDKGNDNNTVLKS